MNLQNADCLINIELPWNPAKLNQRIGRINRIGQKSSKLHIVNMICKNSIEEKVLAGAQWAIRVGMNILKKQPPGGLGVDVANAFGKDSNEGK